MADTPSYPIPLDAREQPILESLQRIRDELTLLKQDRSTYIRTADVMALYDKVVEQVKLLIDVRGEKPTKDSKENRLDRVLEGCFQLISLFFMTIGKNNEAPAAYALTSTIKLLLEHLLEVDLYSIKDLEHITNTLHTLRDNVKRAQAETTYSPKMTVLLASRLDVCQGLLNQLLGKLSRLTHELPGIHEKLISILRLISAANTKTNFSSAEVEKLRAQLKEIDALRVNGNFVTATGEIPAGNEELKAHLERCLTWSEIVLERKGEMPEAFAATYETLVGIRNNLERLSLTQAWSLRETDLYDYQRQLERIDERRINGNFVDAEGKFAELYVQRTLLYLIRRSYAYIYILMCASEPVSEALSPVYNQLQTLRRCLIEVKNSGGVSSPRDLYPYSMKLNSIDNMRKDGKFMVGGDIPEGQGSVNELLAECFELSYELRVAAESEGVE